MVSIANEPAAGWFTQRTFGNSAKSIAELTSLKRDRRARVSVCLPALNESATVGEICRSIQTSLIERHGLVDELVVVDSESEDDTVAVARAAGATVHQARDILRDLPGYQEILGKGDVLWRSQLVLSGDLIVWLDSDTRNFGPHFVVDLIAPLLLHDNLAFVKAFYDRPLVRGDHVLKTGGARVTELMVRPLLNLCYPELTGFIQPLSGEYAARSHVTRRLPFFTGYGVEIGLLIDACQRFGLDALAQVDLGTRIHRNQDVLALGRMSHQILQVMLRRFDDLGRLKTSGDLDSRLTQFLSDDDGPRVETWDLPVRERPPIDDLDHGAATTEATPRT